MGLFDKIFGRKREEEKDNEMVLVLYRLCDAYMRDDKAAIKELEPQATRIGEELNQRGGKKEMLRLFNKLGGMPGSRTLEMHWDGIGDWRG